ncbi:lysis protein [Moellerella wisconsensis]|uniref:Lysis protein n=1 Tax=Moellerella wisconsensis TaxID=158849 RepID=A0ACD3Y467_9GAMM|nr:lysis protein [Moellerella wisconsensis]UNH37801.1 lysis protein [Moellerella wisconsensis]
MSITKLLAGGCAVLAFWLWWVIDDYGKLKSNHQLLTSSFNEQVEITKSYQTRIDALHLLDTKHTQELTNAKAEIDQLRIAAERNPERVYIKASCKKAEGTTAPGLDDAITARPTDSAIQNYWLLRERIAESEQMIKGLQDYININD